MKRVPMLPAIALAGAMMLPTGQAQAFDRGGAIAAGAIGGLAVGTMIGAAATNNYYYGPHAYAYEPAYVAPRAYAYEPVYAPPRRVVRVVRRAPVVAYDAEPYYGYASTYRWGPTVRVGYGPAYPGWW